MATGGVVGTEDAPGWQHAATIWGAELVLLGWLLAVVTAGARVGVVVGTGVMLVVISSLLSAAVERSTWRSTGQAIVALCLSFMAMPPGIMPSHGWSVPPTRCLAP